MMKRPLLFAASIAFVCEALPGGCVGIPFDFAPFS